MSGPVVFTLGDKDYIAKLNQMSQQAGDVQAAKTAAETARTEAQQAVTQAQTAGAAEVTKAAQEVAKAAAHVANAQAIAESGLPAQTGNAGKVLKTNGTATSWGSLAVSDIQGLQARLDELEVLALAGL